MTVAELAPLPPYKAPSVDTWRSWHGFLTMENAGHVAERIRLMLEGKRFTVVRVHENRPMEPEIETGCKLDPRDRASGRPVDWYAEMRTYSSRRFDGERYPAVHVGFSAGNYSYGFGSRLRTQPPWFWLMEPDAELAAKAIARGETHRDPLGYTHGASRDVLAYIDAAWDAHWSTQVVFEDHGRTLRLAERAPIGAMTSVTITVERELTHTQTLVDAVRRATGENTNWTATREARVLVENAEWELGLDG